MKQKLLYPPGDFGIWLIVYIELFTFMWLFIGYAFTRRSNLEMFNASQLLLDQRAGFINTLILITSSFFVVKALELIKQEHAKKASKWVLFAIGLASLFLVIKLYEFADKSAQGIDLETNTFFMFYFLLTSFHFLHVLLGIVILFVLYNNTKKGVYSAKNHGGFESGAVYWHMVDLLWIVLFPLVYIIR
jgi:nitric oxide reductase NorE protein